MRKTTGQEEASKPNHLVVQLKKKIQALFRLCLCLRLCRCRRRRRRRQGSLSVCLPVETETQRPHREPSSLTETSFLEARCRRQQIGRPKSPSRNRSKTAPSRHKTELFSAFSRLPTRRHELGPLESARPPSCSHFRQFRHVLRPQPLIELSHVVWSRGWAGSRP
jgi:hypothetical protein